MKNFSKKGHSFPTKFGFTGSSGKVANVTPHTRKITPRAPAAPAPVGPLTKMSKGGLKGC